MNLDVNDVISALLEKYAEEVKANSIFKVQVRVLEEEIEKLKKELEEKNKE